MPRRSRRASGVSDGFRGAMLAIIGLLLLGVLGAGFWYVKRSRPILDAESNCPSSGPVAIHVLLFDRSDPISDLQAQRIRQEIEKSKENAPLGERFDLYTFNGDTSHVLAPKLSICALGKPGDANQLIENPDRIRKSYETKFSKVLDQTVSDLLKVQSERNSPIIESLRAAAISSFGSIEAGQIPLRVTMISDMVQNTVLTSHFQSEPNFALLVKSSKWSGLQPQLKGADVDILYLLRNTALRRGVQIQNRGHQAFWEQLIAASGGRVTSIEPL